ncbi:UNVERIFIED_CONTAM: hypothetical protein FKN15_025718 [Acipenser sinensis]
MCRQPTAFFHTADSPCSHPRATASEDNAALGQLTDTNFLPARMKHPTHDMNPDRNELNGNVPTNRQYRNCIAPALLSEEVCLEEAPEGGQGLGSPDICYRGNSIAEGYIEGYCGSSHCDLTRALPPLSAPSRLSSWVPSWCPTSMSLLKNTEAKILACIRNDLVSRFVSLPSQDKIWTLTLNPNQNQAASSKTSISATQTSHTSIHSVGRTPLVLVHGFGGGVGLWVHNLDALSQRRTVHAFDLLGFGRSSRPAFSNDPGQAEEQSVHAIEEWRRAMGLDSVILLGHSLGGYLAASYALAHPQRVRHLILVDPWGFPEHPSTLPQTGEPSGGEVKPSGPPRWVKGVASVLMHFNPLAVIRAAGPWEGASHHVYADQPDEFNRVVQEICDSID